MKAGSVVLLRLPQATGGPPKLRPALVLAPLPGPYQNILICGISTQMRGFQPGWDELISEDAPDFPSSGLHRDSAVRLSYIYSADKEEILGELGQIDDSRLRRLLDRFVHLLTGISRPSKG
jgi:mRNA interferase MazF